MNSPMTAISQERLRSAIMAIMQDGRPRTIGDLKRKIDASEEAIEQAVQALRTSLRLSSTFCERLAIYQITPKGRKAA